MEESDHPGYPVAMETGESSRERSLSPHNRWGVCRIDLFPDPFPLSTTQKTPLPNLKSSRQKTTHFLRDD
ncbi:hypothetical protein AVEN_23121-1, partial [Araneus ventricosus]